MPQLFSTPPKGKEAIRLHNLSAALHTIRLKGTISRSRLVDDLALSRTTIAELAQQLRTLDLIVETRISRPSGAGRPSYLLSPSPRVGAFAVNPESDVTTVGFVGLNGELLHHHTVPTPRGSSPQEVVRLCADMISAIRLELTDPTRIVGVGAAIPGQVARADSRVVDAPRLGWRNIDFAGPLQKASGLPVRADNNVRLITEVEFRARTEDGVGHLVYLFGGAGGIGAGVVADGVVLRGAHGFAGELGHMRQSDDERVDFSGLRGTVEALVQRDSLMKALGSPEGDDELIAAGAAHAEVTAAITALGVTIGNIVNTFDPEIVVLGGFLSALAKADPVALRDALTSVALPSLANHVRITLTDGVAEGVLVGAADLWLRDVVADPLGFTSTVA